MPTLVAKGYSGCPLPCGGKIIYCDCGLATFPCPARPAGLNPREFSPFRVGVAMADEEHTFTSEQIRYVVSLRPLPSWDALVARADAIGREWSRRERDGMWARITGRQRPLGRAFRHRLARAVIHEVGDG